MLHSISPWYSEGSVEASRVNFNSMNDPGSIYPLDGIISKVSPLNKLKKYYYQVNPDVEEIAIFVDEKSKFNLLVFDRLYRIISLWADLSGTTVPKSISSIEKNTFEPIFETKDLYLGMTSCPNFFKVACLL